MDKDKLIYSHDTLEFVTVAVKYCAFLEQCGTTSRGEFVETMLKLSSLLYLKAQMLPSVESDGENLPSAQVTESDYEYVRGSVFGLLGEDDQYLDVCGEEELQTEETRWRSVAEHLADVYQPVRDFLAVYQGGIEEYMNDALWAVRENFFQYWGQALVDALRRLHHIQCVDRGQEENEYE